jgi:hypothetical protein
VSVYVESPFDATYPVLTYLNVVTAENAGAVNLTVTVRAESNAPVSWLNKCFDGPNGNIYGGGSGTEFEEIAPGLWEHTWTDTILAAEPDGDYNYWCISVRNQGYLVSEPWPEPVTVTITR